MSADGAALLSPMSLSFDAVQDRLNQISLHIRANNFVRAELHLQALIEDLTIAGRGLTSAIQRKAPSRSIEVEGASTYRQVAIHLRAAGRHLYGRDFEQAEIDVDRARLCLQNSGGAKDP